MYLTALGKTSSSRIVSHGGRPQSISKSDKSAPLPGDVADTGPKEPPILVRYSLDPSFVFLQLYHASFLGSSNEKPEPLPDSEVSACALSRKTHIVSLPKGKNKPDTNDS